MPPLQEVRCHDSPDNGYEVAKAQLNLAMGVEGPTSYALRAGSCCRLVGRPPQDRLDLLPARCRWPEPERLAGELLKLGFIISQRSVARFMLRPRKPPSQSWKTFLANHVADLAAVDFLVVPTATFRILFVFVVLVHHRRQVVHST